ncbi:hypothetical protein MBLNU459_g1575t1 [Dothideomycetes sp. NU459]
MTYSQASAQAALAETFLARIPLAERNLAVKDFAARINNDTIGLVAALVSRCPDKEAQNSLHDFLLRAIDRGEAATAASVCIQYLRIREDLLLHAESRLQTYFALLPRRPKSSGVIVRPSDSSNVEPYADDDIDYELADHVRSTILYLGFLKHLFQISSQENYSEISSILFTTIFNFLTASNLEITAVARETSFAFLAAYKAGAITILNQRPNSDEVHRELWQRIHRLLEHGQHVLYRSTAYAIWLRWLDLPGLSESRQRAMQTDEYWKHIIAALAGGDTEQRKTCLHILRKSLAISRNDISTKDMKFTISQGQDSLTQSQYGRFCTVYETIVIGRYLNQVEECIQDLDALASSQTNVQKSWLFALLEPALSNVTQDSIRKMLGNWIMSTDLNVQNHGLEFGHLLEKSFLPWVTQGNLFTSSMKGKTKNIRCEHGIRLASFVERLLILHSATEHTNARRSIVQAILTFLHNSKNRIIPYAVLYLLHGIVRGLQGEENPCMGPAELELILELSTSTGFPEIARDVLQVHCYELSCFVKMAEDSIATSQNPKLDVLRKRAEILQIEKPAAHSLASSNGIENESQFLWGSVSDCILELESSRHTILQGDGLPTACSTLVSILEMEETHTTDGEQIRQVLDAFWTELEIQDYPRSTILLMPSLVLHPTCVMTSLGDSALADSLVSILSQLQDLSRGRIYIWAPLMSALRVSLLKYPSAARTLNLVDVIVETANHPPSARIEFQLEAAAVQLLRLGHHSKAYSDYYGEYEEAGYAAFFDILNRLGQIDSAVALTAYKRLLLPWITQKLPVPVVNKWKTTGQLQIMLILLEQSLATMTTAQAREELDILCKVVAVEPLPRYRYLLEWMIARIIIQHPGVGEDVLERLSTMDHHSNPKYLASLTKIAVMIASLDDCAEAFAARVVSRLVALSSSSKIIIRHEAQWSFPILWDHAEKQGWMNITSNPASASLNGYIRSLERFMVPPPQRELERLDPKSGHNLANLFQGGYLRLEPQGDEIVTVEDFQKLQNHDSSNSRLSAALPLPSMVLSEPSYNLTTNKHADILGPEASQQDTKASARTEAFAALQTKGTAYLSTTTDSDSTRSRPTDLVVVGSLVDNAYNLGGLSRISEIFGASALYISHAKAVLANKDFVSVAVASQHHLPIHDLPVEGLQAFLTAKKAEGYAIVGVEQTDRSRMLGDEGTLLPAKTVLVTGAEKEGIPAGVLGECDLLVEVPQRGVTRSMNVQTAAGVVLYEYARQHRAK